MITSAQDFRNLYERFYAEFCCYLWPYHVLEDLANLEVEIYTAFFDVDKLKRYLEKLRRPVDEVVKEFEDERLKDLYDKIVDLANKVDANQIVQQISRVEEVNPDEDKQINPEEEQDDSESEFEIHYADTTNPSI